MKKNVIRQTDIKMSSHLLRVKEGQDCYDQLGEENQSEAERKLKRRKGMHHTGLKDSQGHSPCLVV